MEALMQTWSFFVDAFTPVWENLRTQPSLWLAVTLVAYAFGMWLYKKSGFKTIFTPLLTSIVIIVATLLATHTDYTTYMQGGQHINFLLGPATVALAVPLYEQRLRLAKLWIPLTCGLVACAQKRHGADRRRHQRTSWRHSGFNCRARRDHGRHGGPALPSAFCRATGKERGDPRLCDRPCGTRCRYCHCLPDEPRHRGLLRACHGTHGASDRLYRPVDSAAYAADVLLRKTPSISRTGIACGRFRFFFAQKKRSIPFQRHSLCRP